MSLVKPYIYYKKISIITAFCLSLAHSFACSPALYVSKICLLESYSCVCVYSERFNIWSSCRALRCVKRAVNSFPIGIVGMLAIFICILLGNTIQIYRERTNFLIAYHRFCEIEPSLVQHSKTLNIRKRSSSLKICDSSPLKIPLGFLMSYKRLIMLCNKGCLTGKFRSIY